VPETEPVVSVVLPMVSVVQSRLVMTAESEATTPEKPFCETTGPEKVVVAIKILLTCK
jgi:hypothetical protein